MVVKDYDYIKGNTVTKPQRKGNEAERKKYEELQRSKRRRKKRQVKDAQRKRMAALQIAMVVFIFGVFIIARDAKVYSMQREVTKINKEIKMVVDENEAIRVDLLKVASLENIRTYAEEKLGMSVATKADMIPVDLSQNYFAELENEKTIDNSEEKSLFSKLMDALDL